MTSAYYVKANVNPRPKGPGGISKKTFPTKIN